MACRRELLPSSSPCSTIQINALPALPIDRGCTRFADNSKPLSSECYKILDCRLAQEISGKMETKNSNEIPEIFKYKTPKPPIITIILLCRNRPDMALEALNSILMQNFKGIKIIVSDNSDNKNLYNQVGCLNGNIQYYWSEGAFDSLFNHFNYWLQKITTPYFTIFHDDDILEAGYVSAILETFNAYPEAAAVSVNAAIIDVNGKPTGKTMRRDEREVTKIINNKQEFLTYYVNSNYGGLSPFSCYTYNMQVMRGLTINSATARNYSDTVYLSSLLDRGPIIWLNSHLAKVRMHTTTLSFYSGVRDYKAFITWVRLNNRDLIDCTEYRYFRLYFSITQRRRFSLASIKYLIKKFPYLMFSRKDFRLRFLRKLKNLR